MGLRHALIDLGPLRSSARFRRLWLGQACSSFGGQMTLVAVMFQIWQATGSSAWIGAVGIAQAAPIIACSLFAGALVDHGDRRRLYLVATTGQAVCSLALAVQGFAGHVPPAGVLLLVAAQSCFAAVAGPAARTFIPRLLPRPQVAAALALQRISFQGAMLVGPALAGLVVAGLGVGGCYAVDAITFGLSFYGGLGLPRMAADGASARPGLHGVIEGLGFLVRDRVVRGALLIDLAATVLAMPLSLFPVINAQRFGGDPRTLGLFLSAIAVGGVVASLLSGAFTRRVRPDLAMISGAVVWGGALALFGVTSNPWLALGVLAVAGAADTVSVVSRGTIVQLHTPERLLGRVVAAEQVVGRAGPDLGNLRGGVLAGLTSGPFALVSGGLLCVAAVLLVGATGGLAVRGPETAPGEVR